MGNFVKEKKKQKKKNKYSRLLTPNRVVMGFGVKSSGVLKNFNRYGYTRIKP